MLFSQEAAWQRLLLVVVAALALTACSSVDGEAPQPVQSPNDDYQYRYLVLDNQLPVLLISDTDAPKAAASLDVMVGSGDNPSGRGGLAHFLEHMLFLGTDKYPDAAEYEQYITEHGGSRNAYTSFEHTNYFFDINAEFLPEALDRFAQFFIAPRFDAQYVDREKNAVQAEYQMGITSDGRRGLDVLQEVMNPEHPFSQFSVGSLETLADRPDSSIREEMIAFYNKHYSANAMRLVVLGNESLDELEALVTPMFNAVPNRDYQPPQIEAPLFKDADLPLLVQVEPQATSRSLSASFQIPDFRDDYHVKPANYLSNLLGHEGTGSLLSQLKAEGLAESLSAGAGLGWRGGALLSINVTLTEAGAADYDRVLQLMFDYVVMLREAGPQQRLYEEQSALAALSFRFREESSAIGYVSALSSGMHYYAPEDILRGPYIMDDYRADELSSLLEYVRPERALVVFTDKTAMTDRKSQYYEVAYSAQTLAGERVAGWEVPVEPAVFALPAPNPFIAEDVSLVAISEDNPEIPERRLEQQRQTIWFQQDDEFRIPKGALSVNFRSPLVGGTPENAASALMYTNLLQDSVNELTYPALLAGLNFSFYKHSQGVSLRLSGYTDKQEVLLAQLVEAIRSPQFSEDRFENIRRNMIRNLENAVAKRPSSQVIDDLREAILYGQWGEQAIINGLKQLSLEDLQQYSTAFWASATAESLLFGNYTAGAPASLATTLEPLLASGEPVSLPPLEVLKLAPGENLQYTVAVDHSDSVIAWYLQGGGNSYADRAATALAGQVTKSGFFQQLRTEQQLGYVVSSFSWAQLDVPALVLLIQSPSHSAPEVSTAMSEFMARVPGELDAAQFERHKAALVNDLRRPDKNLWERAEFYWQSIAKKQYQFDDKQRLADTISGVALDDWLAYFQQHFLNQAHSLQVVTAGRWGKFPDLGAQRLDSAAQIKADHARYVIQ